MWLVPHHDPVPGDAASALPPAAAAGLRAAYAGCDDASGEAAAIRLVREARQFQFWIACDCRAREGVFPLMTPAYLSTAKVYYLRRLTGEGRPEHDGRCVFRFDRPASGLGPIRDARPAPIKPPTGYFSVIESDEDARLTGNGADRRRGPAYDAPPRLARLLWRLMVAAGLNRLTPVQYAEKPSIRAEVEKLRTAAEGIDVARDLALTRVLATHPRDYHGARLFARIRDAYKSLPEKEPLQGFLLVYCADAKGKALLFGEEEPILVAGELARPAREDDRSRAPYLALSVIGDHAQGSGLMALRAYAQPIYSGAQFMPVASDFERQVLKAINAARWSLAKTHPALEVTVEKPLFDIRTPDGPCLPDFIVEATDAETGEVRVLVVEAMGLAGDFADEAAKRLTHARMAHIGPVLGVEPAALDVPKQLPARIKDAMLGH
jgi:hypothetical protein